MNHARRWGDTSCVYCGRVAGSMRDGAYFELGGVADDGE